MKQTVKVRVLIGQQFLFGLFRYYYYICFCGGTVDALVLETRSFGSVGSNPTWGTRFLVVGLWELTPRTMTAFSLTTLGVELLVKRCTGLSLLKVKSWIIESFLEGRRMLVCRGGLLSRLSLIVTRGFDSLIFRLIIKPASLVFNGSIPDFQSGGDSSNLL